jgi:hypothetical protein
MPSLSEMLALVNVKPASPHLNFEAQGSLVKLAYADGLYRPTKSRATRGEVTEFSRRSQANFAPAQFVDSDLFDGYTNRRGWLVWLGRQLWPNTELALTCFKGDSIDDGATFASPDASSADRMRLQTDFIVKF